MARIEDPETRRFVKEATTGMVVIAGLLALIVVGIARRFGAWERTIPASDVQAAQIYGRAPRIVSVPRTSLESDPGQSEPSERMTNGDSTPLTRSIPKSSPPTRVSTASPPTVRPLASPAQLSPASGLPQPGARVPATNVAQQTTPAEATETHEPIPVPFRKSPAIPASLQRTVTGTQDSNSRDETVPPDPKWTVRVDDTLWTFCERNFGDPQWFRAFHAWLASRGVAFDEVEPGRVLQPPTKSELRQACPDLVPRERAPSSPADANLINETGGYTTTGNESLFDVAARVLGQAARYVELVELNRDQIPPGTDYLTPLPNGTRLTMPAR